MVQNGVEEEVSGSETAVDQRDRLRGLTSSTEWGMVLAFINDQCNKRVLEIMTTVEWDAESAAKVHFSKGEYNGMQLVKAFVESQLQTAEDLVALYKEQAKLENSSDV